MPRITLAQAELVIGAAKARARELGVAVSVAVVDGRGDLVALERMDGAGYFAADFARGKAMVAGVLGQPSGGVASPDGPTVMQTALGRIQHGQISFVFMQGGVPIRGDGQLLGGVGVGGASSVQDEEIAFAGAEAA